MSVLRGDIQLHLRAVEDAVGHGLKSFPKMTNGVLKEAFLMDSHGNLLSATLHPLVALLVRFQKLAGDCFLAWLFAFFHVFDFCLSRS